MRKGSPTGRGLVGDSSTLEGHERCRQGTAQITSGTRGVLGWFGGAREGFPPLSLSPTWGHAMSLLSRGTLSPFPIDLQGYQPPLALLGAAVSKH